MAVTSFPFDNQTTTETQYSRLFREAVSDGVGAAGDLQVSANSTGMTVSVAPGFATVRGHAILSDADVALALDASTAGIRIDTIVARLDPAANSVVLAAVKGTPGAGPPDLKATDAGLYELPLADVLVGANVATITAGSVSDRRQRLAGDVASWTTSGRPASPRAGRLGYNLDQTCWEGWTGTAWTPIGGPVKRIWTATRGGNNQSTDAYGGDTNFDALLLLNIPATAPAGLYRITSQLCAGGRNGRYGTGYLRTEANGANTTLDQRLDLPGFLITQTVVSYYQHAGGVTFPVRMSHRCSVASTVVNSATRLEVQWIGAGTL